MTTYYTHLTSPAGPLQLVGDGEILQQLSFVTSAQVKQIPNHWIENTEPFINCQAQLTAYFKGDLQQFEIPLLPKGTVFQLQILHQLQQIPYGTTCSYMDVARAMGSPKAVRAVGAAMGRNPIAIIVPCHRVVGSNGCLTGFAGGLKTKAHLLQLEGSLNQYKYHADTSPSA
jgi:methylated-DNA-[protein]-cysteine S-methyltransferase